MAPGSPQPTPSTQAHEDTDLVDVLAEGGHRGELADEVQVGCSQGVERTAVVHG